MLKKIKLTENMIAIEDPTLTDYLLHIREGKRHMIQVIR